MSETIYCHEDILKMLDALLKEQPTINWDNFYSGRDKPVPFFVNVPDENLVHYFSKNMLSSGGGRALELGCGHGRNAIYLAKQDFAVDAVDSSQKALQWAIEMANEQDININFIQKNIFELEFDHMHYDVIYDSGCFHHIAPHRRIDYVNLLNKALKPGGFFGITCFVENGIYGGSTMTDWDIYRKRSIDGGLGYSPEKLKEIFTNFEVIEIRKMLDIKQPSDCFGISGLWTALFQKKK